MFDFFVSYSRADSARFAEMLSARLRELGWEVWLDRSDIPASVPWREEVEHAISQSVVFIALTSPGWRNSTPCRLERETAQRAEVPIFELEPTSHPDAIDSAAKSAVIMIRDIPAWRRVALELSSSAATWRAAGRHSSLLAKGRTLRTFRALQRSGSDSVPFEARAYLRESTRRQQRRVTAGVLAALTVPSLVLVTRVGSALLEAGTEQVQQSVTDVAQASGSTLFRDWNPYLALEAAAQPDSGTYLGDSQLALALAVPVPEGWDPATEDDRALTAASGFAASPDGMSVATANGSAVDVTTVDDRRLVRIEMTGPVSSVAWSPDGRWVAGIVGDHIDVVSTVTSARISLGGSPRPLESVGWRDDQRVLAVTDDGHLAMWRALHFDQLIAASERRVVDGAMLNREFISMGSDGSLMAIDTESGALRSTAPSPAGISWAIDATESAIVAVPLGADEPFLRVFDPVGLLHRDIQFDGCAPSDVSVGTAAQFAYIACSDYAAARVDVGTGDVLVVSQDHQLTGVQVVSNGVLFGGSDGVTIQTTEDLEYVRDAFWPGCPLPVRRFAADLAGDMVFPAGDDTGVIGCSVRADRSGGEWDTHRIVQPLPTSRAARTVAVSEDGALVAFGYADGSVRVLTTKNFLPVLAGVVLPVSIRAIGIAPGGTSIVLGGDDGRILRIPLPIAGEGERENLREIAVRRLEFATRMGLYQPMVAAASSASPPAR